MMTVRRKLPTPEQWLLHRLAGLGAMPQVQALCEHYGETVERALLSDYRFSSSVRARHATWNLLNQAYGLKCSDIARMFGANKSTVTQALRNLRKIKNHDENTSDTGTFIRIADGYERISPLPAGRNVRASGVRE